MVLEQYSHQDPLDSQLQEENQHQNSSIHTTEENRCQMTSFSVTGKLDPLSLKLDHKNYLLWRQLALASIRGHGLIWFIEEARYVPERFLVDGSVNEDFFSSKQHDQLLNSVSQDILTQLLGCTTSFEIWNTLAHVFMSRTRANVMQYKQELQKLNKVL